MKISPCRSAAFALVSLLLPLNAGAEDLLGTLTTAYQNNPVLEAERAGVRATDENVSQAKAGWRPTLSADGNFTYRKNTTNQTFTSNGITYPKTAGLSIEQPLFRGFQTVNATKQAKKQVGAARAGLIITEQDILLQTVTAYVDVKRDEEVLILTKNNVSVLQRQLEASEDRFRVGEITRTDVAQSKARLSRAISERIQAEATLTSSRAAFTRVVGSAPGTLENAEILGTLPASEQAALEITLRESPTLKAAKYQAEAARYNVKRLYGGFMPTVSLTASYNKTWSNFLDTDRSTTSQIAAQLRIPLYQAGTQSSLVRQARQVENQRRLEAVATERQVQENVRNAWEGYREATARISSTIDQMEANSIALEGVRQEAEVGSRTTLDVLDAEQELLDSRVSNARSQRDQIVAAYQLLRATGQLTARNLKLGGGLYDPRRNADAVDGRFYGWKID